MTKIAEYKRVGRDEIGDPPDFNKELVGKVQTMREQVMSQVMKEILGRTAMESDMEDFKILFESDKEYLIYKGETKGFLQTQFFEQDADNIVHDLVTVRVQFIPSSDIGV